MSQIHEIVSNGLYEASPFSSITGVGYDKVNKIEVDNQGNTLGRTETEFWNTPDHGSYMGANARTYAVSYTLPLIKQYENPENGSPKTVAYYNQAGIQLKQVGYEYENHRSEVFYGARIFPYKTLIAGNANPCNGGDMVYFYSQHLIGYYPLFDYETFLRKTTVTEWDAKGHALVTESVVNYDAAGQPAYKQRRTADGGYEELYFTYPYDHYACTEPGHEDLKYTLNKAQVVSLRTQKRDKTYQLYKEGYRYDKEYATVLGQVVERKVRIVEDPQLAQEKITTYEAYDTQGNPLQVTTNGISQSYMWGYNKTYVVAEVRNAPVDRIAFTSFETDDHGGWTLQPGYTLIANNGNITGKKSLSGSITITVPTGDYMVTLWSAANTWINGQAISQPQREAGPGKRYFEQRLTGVSTITVAADNMDEVRLYPVGAQMTTYTYDPLIGITSQTDAAGRITYYEYDAFGRLTGVKDEGGNLLNQHNYHYKQ